MSWRLGSLLFKLCVTPSALSVAQRHCTILVVIIAIRNLPLHPGDVHIIPIVIPRIVFDTSARRGTLFVAPRVEHHTMEVGEWQTGNRTEIPCCQWMFLQKRVSNNSNKGDIVWSYWAIRAYQLIISFQHKVTEHLLHTYYLLLTECIWRDTEVSFLPEHTLALSSTCKAPPPLFRGDDALGNTNAGKKGKRLFQKVLSKCELSWERMFYSWN